MQEKITRKQFEALGNESDEHPLIKVLKINKDYGITVKYILKNVKKSESLIAHMLRQLVKQKKVEHKKPYFIWKK